MTIHIDEAVLLGAKILSARRRVWDLERQLPRTLYHDTVKRELRDARQEYRKLLDERKRLVKRAQIGMFE